MGKLQSKHASTPRENPEGGALPANRDFYQSEQADVCYETDKMNAKQALRRELWNEKDVDLDGPLEVILPPEETTECLYHNQSLPHENGGQHPFKRHLNSNDVEYNLPVTDENCQEWIFTLYDFGNSSKVHKEDMTRLMQTIFEVVEASIRQSVLSKSTSLRIRLIITTASSGNRGDRDTRLTLAERSDEDEILHCPDNVQTRDRGQITSPPINIEKKHYRVHDNTERRNHYLKLAGLENCNSQVEADSDAEEHRLGGLTCDPHSRQHRPFHPESPLGACFQGTTPFLHSPRSHGKSAGAGGDAARLFKPHSHHPSVWCQPFQNHQTGHRPLEYSHSKKLHIKSSTPSKQSSPDRDFQPVQGTSCGGVVSLAQRHKHHHLHEHHHHHHHHHHHYH